MARIFISYAHEDSALADELHFRLEQIGHPAFFDKSSIKPGDGYDAVIRNAIANSDLFIFLASPASVAPGCYALTELGFAASKWPDPSGHVIPVLLPGLDEDAIPNYLKGASWLKAEGNLLAEIVAVVADLSDAMKRRRLGRYLGIGTVAAIVLAGVWIALSPSGKNATPGPATARMEPAASTDVQGTVNTTEKLTKAFGLARDGAQLSFFEKTFDTVPKNVENAARVYEIDGCTLIVLSDKGAIDSMRLELSTTCSFDINTLLYNYKLSAPDQMAFGNFADVLHGATFSASCLMSCGNAFVPEFYLTWEGPHAENFLVLTVGGYYGKTNVDALWPVVDAMRKADGDDYVVSNKFNCDGKYGDQLLNAVRNIKIEFVIIGHPFTASPLGEKLGNCQ